MDFSSMSSDIIIEIRKGFLEELKNSDESPKRLKVNSSVAEKIIFDIDEFGMKTFAFPIELMKKINFQGISFDDFFAYGFDFSGFKGVSIDPQRVFDKDLSYSNLNGVTIINTFDGVLLDGAQIEGMIYKTWENKFKKLTKRK